MNIISATVVYWFDSDLGNPPCLKIVVDEIPLDGFLFEKRQSIYRAESQGFVRFFHYDGPGKGYGGSSFPIKMIDGSEEVLIGPWSSRAGQVNRLFPPCVDVIVETDEGQPYTGAITLERALEALSMVDMSRWFGYPGSQNQYHFDLALTYTVTGDVVYMPVLSKVLGGTPQVFVDEITVAFAREMLLEQKAILRMTSASHAMHIALRELREMGGQSAVIEELRTTMVGLNLLVSQLQIRPKEVFEVVNQWVSDNSEEPDDSLLRQKTAKEAFVNPPELIESDDPDLDSLFEEHPESHGDE